MRLCLRSTSAVTNTAILIREPHKHLLRNSRVGVALGAEVALERILQVRCIAMQCSAVCSARVCPDQGEGVLQSWLSIVFRQDEP